MTTTLDTQRRLLELGFSPGPLDGKPGPKTEAAIRKFQAARALVVDGIAGPKTLAALFPAMPATAPAPMTTSAAGRAAIARREGVRLQAYRDSVGVWTIGVGHTSAAGPPLVRPDLTISRAECDAILSRDLATFEAAVRHAVEVELSQHQFDALVSLAFNIGAGAFARSSVVKRLNAYNAAGAASAFLSWTRAGGKVLPGLVARRKDERAQFLAA